MDRLIIHKFHGKGILLEPHKIDGFSWVLFKNDPPLEYNGGVNPCVVWDDDFKEDNTEGEDFLHE